MACNVYGTPVTDATLKGMTEYHDKEITAVDRARVALLMKNAEGKDTQARSFTDEVGKILTRGGVKCVIYNATGGPLKLVTVFEFLGGVAMSPFPTILQNGQWGSLVHEKTPEQSSAALVYESPKRQWVLGWLQTGGNSNKCLGELRQHGYYSMTSSGSVLQTLRNLIQGAKNLHEVQDAGDIIFSSIGNTASPIYEAIMTMTDAAISMQ